MRRAAALLLLALPGLAVAEDDQSWVGKRVMVKRDGVMLRFIDADGGLVGLGRVQEPVVTVTGQGRGWLGIRQGGREGWFPQYDAVLLADAPRYFTDLLQSQPDNPNGLLWRGRAWFELGENEKAVADFTEAIRLRPKFPLALNERGITWHRMKEYDKAITDLTEVIQLAPRSAYGFSNRGAVWEAKRKYDKAIADLTEAIRLDPKDASTFRNRSRVWHDKGEDDKAIVDLTEAIRLDPGFTNAYRERGIILDAKGQHDEAIASITEAIRIYPGYALAYVSRGTVWYNSGEYDKAVTDLTEAIRLNPQEAPAFNRRGQTWYAKKEYEKAIADFTESIRLDPTNDFPWHNRAWIRATCPDVKLRDGKQAVEDARKACELTGWKNASDLGVLAAAYAEDGQFGEAVKWLKKALGDDKYKQQYGRLAQKQLKLYEENKPYREK